MLKHEQTINDVKFTLTPAKTEPREGRASFDYLRLDVSQFADTANPMAVAEIVGTIAGHDVVAGWIQASLDRAFQAAQKESGKDTLDDTAKLKAVIAYMIEAKFGLSKSTNISPAERIAKTFETTKKALVEKLKAKTITHTEFAREIAAASTTMTTDLLALPTESEPTASTNPSSPNPAKS